MTKAELRRTIEEAEVKIAEAKAKLEYETTLPSVEGIALRHGLTRQGLRYLLRKLKKRTPLREPAGGEGNFVEANP